MTELNTDSRVQTLLAAFRHIGLPLLQAILESPAAKEAALAKGDGGKGFDIAASAPVFESLVESTINLTKNLSTDLDIPDDDHYAGVLWELASSASKIVASSYKTTARVMAPEDTRRIADIAATLRERFHEHIPADQQAQTITIGMFRARMAEAMVPVIGAVAQYSFGRAEHALLGEISDRLVRNADQVTRALAPSGATPEQWRTLCWGILRASGHIYAESHYAEADRLLYMNADDRRAYFAQHDNIVPMKQVWQAFNQRMAMLATLATYLEVPASANLGD